MRYKQWIYVLLVIFGFSCKTIVDTPKSFEGDKIIFGNGGGFTGAVTSYTLLGNGQLFVNESLSGDQWVEQNRLNRKVVQSIFEDAKALKLADRDHNFPGNTYKFIRTQLQDGEQYVGWGASDHPISKDIEAYYFKLMDVVNPNE